MTRREPDDDIDAIPLDTAEEWPAPLAMEALHGLAGDFVRVVGPETEADPVALLTSFLAAFGSMMGAAPHARAEADRHGGNLFVCLVGRTAKGRKGTSLGHVRRLSRQVDATWDTERVVSGLSSGEGLIWAVRDPILGTNATGEPKVVDEGVIDKRLLVIESEFASPLKVMAREGNTLSPLIRQAWDTGALRSLTKNSPAKATGAHITILGHVTKAEIRKNLNETEALNGFGNRFLWVCVRRSKTLPEGGCVHEGALAEIAARTRAAVDFARRVAAVPRDADARELWIASYGVLSADRPGLLGAMTGRAEAQVVRLALLYALLDRSGVVTEPHLRAALALWRYAEDSARYVFGDATGDPLADTILDALRGAAPAGLTRTEVRKRVGGHAKAKAIVAALSTLRAAGLAHVEVDKATGGRPAERWFTAPGAGRKAKEGSKAPDRGFAGDGAVEEKGGKSNEALVAAALLPFAPEPDRPEGRAVELSSLSSLRSPPATPECGDAWEGDA